MDVSAYPFFRRDMSWLSFNERVLMEAADRTLPVYDRIKFLSIFSSNLEEFYTVRVAYHQAVLQKRRDNISQWMFLHIREFFRNNIKNISRNNKFIANIYNWAVNTYWRK